jgi:hypothetical protein
MVLEKSAEITPDDTWIGGERKMADREELPEENKGTRR